MPGNFLTIEEAAAELKMTKDQIGATVKSGKLRQFVDQGVQKFRREDIEAYKKRAQGEAAVTFEKKKGKDEDSSHVNLGAVAEGAGAAKDETEFTLEAAGKKSASRIDLADVEAEPGADESDQTSVLPVAEDAGTPEEAEAEPVFDFAEEDLGLSAEEKPSGSVLVSDEGESSADILEVAKEVEEGSSSDAIVPIRDDSEIESGTISDSDVVTDILDTGAAESDDDLDTIDLDDVALPEAPAGGDELMTVIEEAAPGSSADTAPLGAGEVGEEGETVSLEEAEAATADVGAMLPGEEVEGEIVYDEERSAEPAAGYVVPAPMVDYLPSTGMNALLVVSVALAVFGGFMMLCDMAGATANPVVEFVHQQVKSLFPNL